ncbi:hypothetical protein X777_12238, partial [Ooceraea biroi]
MPQFPKKEKIRQLWLDILELSAESVPVGGRICSAHFSEDAFDLSTGTRKLRPNTLPYKVVDASTTVSPKRKFNSPEKSRLRKKLRETKNLYLKKIKVLQQKLRRKDSKIISLKGILNALKETN